MSKLEQIDEKGQSIIKTTMELAFMDKEGKSALELLSDKLSMNEMKHFNPVLEKIPEVVSCLGIKYVEDDPESIRAFIDSKKINGAFNTTMTKSKKEMKAGLTPTIKAIDTIFNKFKKLYDQAKEHGEREFKPYLDEQARIKAEEEAKKTEALNKEMEEIKKQNEDLVAKQRAQNALNSLKHDVVSRVITNMLSSLNSYNYDALVKEKERMASLDVEGFVRTYSATPDNFAMLTEIDDGQMEALKIHFEMERNRVVDVMETRLPELLALERSRNAPAPPTTPEPGVPMVEVPEVIGKQCNVVPMNPTEFIDYQLSVIEGVKLELEAKLDSFEGSDRDRAGDIIVMLSRMLDFINSK